MTKNLESLTAVHTHTHTHSTLENKTNKYKKGRVVGSCDYLETG